MAGSSLAISSPRAQMYPRTSKQAGLTIPTRGLGIHGPSPASPEQGVQHLQHKMISVGIRLGLLQGTVLQATRLGNINLAGLPLCL